MPPLPENGTVADGRSNRYSGGYSQGNGAPRDSRPPSGQGYHIDDLCNEAQRRIRELGPVPLKHLIDCAMTSLRAAEMLLNQRRRDQAYIEFLVAYDIAVEQVPRNQGWPDLKLGRNQLYQTYKDLMARLQLNDECFRNVKDIISNENKRSAAQPRSRPSSAASSSRPSTANGVRVPDGSEMNRISEAAGYQNGIARGDAGSAPSSRPMSVTDATANNYSSRSAYIAQTSSRPKPPARPKPEALHGHVIPHERPIASESSSQDLAERFARLRGPSAAAVGATNYALPEPLVVGNAVPDGSISTTLSSPEFYDSSEPSSYPPSLRPAGPRDMRTGPERPPKLPLDTAAAISMPKPPSPTYSPARNMQTPAGVNPPRTTARSTVGTGGRTNSMASSISSRAPGYDTDPSSYFPRVNGNIRADDSRRRGFVGLPTSDRSIRPDVLYDCLNLYNVLLIDVRPRDHFDRGHIDHASIICIEPLTLRQSMSAEELQNTLVLAPDVEQVLFDRRDKFDLVVYFDSSTEQTRYLTSPDRTIAEDALRTLFDALWEFNSERPLKKPPLLLAGGLHAWEALLGRPALATSDTSSTKASKERAPSRKPLPPPSAPQQLVMAKKRRREFNPIEADELRKWEERARQESLPLELPPADEEEEVDVGEDEGEEESAFYRTAADFLRRYPAIPIERESMVQPHRGDLYPPARAPPQPPGYPEVDAMPEFPSRPPPTAPRVSYSGAHERTVAPYNSQSRSSSLRPYVPPKDMPQNIRMSKTGLMNFGVTCYMNATIQCLNATLPLTQVFRDGSYKKYIQRDSWKGSKGLLPENYANLVHHLWRGDVMACRPSTFRNFCARLNREWGIDRQQDAKEFFDFVIDFLHEDLNINWRNPPPHVLSATEEEIREKMHKAFAAQIEWTRYQKRDKSIISDLFAGQHASRLRCLVCNHTSTTYEAFYSISVEIPRQGAGDIYQCLASYCHEERLAADERWKCPACKREREATKQITITRAPRNLVVHFKRFRASHNESARKVSTPIAFPLTGLDITPFMLAPPTPVDAETTFRATGDPKWRDVVTSGKLEGCMVPPFRYDAYAVIRHVGASVASGHYIAVTHDPGRAVWRVFNDDRVHDIEPDRGPDAEAVRRWMTNEQAYIAFYQRVG